MAKRKRKRGKSKAQSSAALRRNGLTAFKRGDYNRAIDAWERVAYQTPSMRPTAALAEAYFRRGVGAADPQAGLSDLQKAAELQPKDPCYAYHLGLAAHRQGNLDQAITAYRLARKKGEFATRAAYPLALALLQQSQDPAADPVWSGLPAEEQAMLSQADLFRRRPYTLSADAPLLWQGLVALDDGRREDAAAGLELALETAVNPAAKGVAHYYLGILAAQEEEWNQARRQWNTARAGGLTMPRLEANLGELYHRLAEKRLAAPDADPEGALMAVQEAARLKPDDNQLKGVISQARQGLAYQAAAAGRWKTAHDHWQAAVDAVGGSFRLAYNLALAYERDEDFSAAGETWREALRRRPRRADHPDAISDEQVARLWQRAAEAYRKAGEYEEATHVYRQAVKWNPDNVEMRLALAEGLLADGRTQAAENELNRVLERDPDNVPVLLRLGEAIFEGRSWWQRGAALKCWNKVLELQPDNVTARQLLADFYQEQAEAAASWDKYERAIEMYRQALEYQPQNGKLLAALGGCHFQMDNETAALIFMEEALDSANANLIVYDAIIRVWLEADEPDEAWKTLAQAEAAVKSIPYDFYLSQAGHCLEDDRPDLARPWLDRAIEKAPPGTPILMAIGELATMTRSYEIGREYLEKALAAGQEPGQAYLVLGVISASEGDMKTAKKHWKEAERVARRTSDGELFSLVQETRDLFSGPFGMFSRMMMGGGLGSLDLSDFLGDDEFDDDDDDFF